MTDDDKALCDALKTGFGDGAGVFLAGPGAVVAVAAARRIEALAGEVERLTAEQSHPVVGLALDDCRRAEAEVERLKANIAAWAICAEHGVTLGGTDAK